MTPDPPPTDRVRTDGKFFRLGADPFTVRGVTYGPVEPVDGVPLPPPARVAADFRQLADLHANVVRVYRTPPAWFLDSAAARGVHVLLDVAWPKNLCVDGDPAVVAAAHAAVAEAATARPCWRPASSTSSRPSRPGTSAATGSSG